ncbi:MAG TPA: hypothetical protein VK906_05585 [Egicoccus sp.]|nr:hypothetical protein [Egicoccus sp.]HSK22622.1 hypothetical protein [Egicoccus sp.]
MSTPAVPETPVAQSGEGQRHALVLALALTLPLVAWLVERAATTTEDFPRVLTLVATAITALVAVVLVPDSLKMTLRQVGARVLGVVMLALAIRFAHPNPVTAWTAYRGGDETLASSRLIVPLLAMLLALGAGQVIATKVTGVIVGTRAANADRARESTALQVWFGATIAMLLLAASDVGRVAWVQTLLVLGPLVALATLADLRTRLRGPDSDRPIVRAGPRRTIGTTALVALAAVMLGGVAGVAVLPERAMDGLGRPSEWIGNAFDWDFRQRTGGRDGVVGGGGEHRDREPGEVERPFDDRTTPLFSNVPNPPWWLVAAGVALLAWVVFKPRYWRTLLGRVWALVRGLFGLAGAAEGDVASWSGETHHDRRAGGRLRDALQRVLPRPRDPRQAIVFDYLRVERALAGEGDDHPRARALWETPLEHADRVTLGEAYDELAALTSTARFAKQPPSAADAERSLDLRHAVERHLRDRDAPAQGSEQAPVA